MDGVSAHSSEHGVNWAFLKYWLRYKARQDGRFLKQFVVDSFRTARKPLATPQMPVGPDEITLVWLGHSTVLLHHCGVRVLTDPVLMARVGPGAGRFILGPKRFIRPALAIDALPPLDLVLVSHAHMDHLDLNTLRRLPPGRAITAVGTSDLFASAPQLDVTELGWGERLVVETQQGPIEVEAVPVNHPGARLRQDTHRTSNAYLIRRQGISILFAGDTAYTDSFGALAAEPPSVALMPIGGYDPYIHKHISPEQAVSMAGMAKARFCLPIHHDTFRVSEEPREQPRERFLSAPPAGEGERVAWRVGERFRVPRPGQRRTSAAPELVVLTQCHVRFGYNVARSLVAAGYRVVALGAQAPGMCAGLPGVVEEGVYPEPFANPLAYVEALDAAARRTGAALIVPVHEDIFVASRYRDRFGAAARLAAPPFETLLAVHDKRNLVHLAERAGISTPRTRALHDAAQLGAMADELGLPLVLKPRFGEGSQGVFVLRTRRDVRAARDRIAAHLAARPYLAQAYVRGQGACMGCLMSGGRAVALGGHLRLREVPLSGGTSTARVTLLDTEVEAATARLLQEAGVDGICMVEYRRTPDGRFFLLDVNPRYWGGLSTPVRSGVDFPVLHAEVLLGRRSSAELVRAQRQVETRWALGELRVLPELILRGQWQQAREALRVSGRPEVVYEDIGWRELPRFVRQAHAYWERWRRYRASGGVNLARAAFFRQLSDRTPSAPRASVEGGG